MLSVHTNEQRHDRNTHALTPNSRHDSVTDNSVKRCAEDAQHSQGLWGRRWKIPDFKKYPRTGPWKRMQNLEGLQEANFKGKVYITPLWKSHRKRCSISLLQKRKSKVNKASPHTSQKGHCQKLYKRFILRRAWRKGNPLLQMLEAHIGNTHCWGWGAGPLSKGNKNKIRILPTATHKATFQTVHRSECNARPYKPLEAYIGRSCFDINHRRFFLHPPLRIMKKLK